MQKSFQAVVNSSRRVYSVKHWLQAIIPVVLILISCSSTAIKSDSAEAKSQSVIFVKSLSGEDLILPTEGIVPDSATAVKIAEAIWLPIYGESINDKHPFHAKLMKDSIWAVEGTMPIDTTIDGEIIMYEGGVPYAEICKADGRVIGVIHGK